MNRTCRLTGLAILATLCLIGGSAESAKAQAQPPAQAPAQGADAGAGKQQYTMAEYNSYQACAAEKNPQAQIKCLDDFVAKYPTSALLNFVYPLYYQAYGQLKNFPKVMEYADKTLALGDKINAGEKYQALYARAFAYNSMNSPDPALAKTAQAAAIEGLKALEDVKKPDQLTDDAFATQKKQIQIYFNGTAAQAAMVQKDYPSAIQSYKKVLELNPDDAITNYRLGLAYMQSTPPAQLDAFWSFARAVTSKGANQQQSQKVKDYLRKVLANYQQAACDNLVDAELNELLQLAGSSPTRPDTYKIASAADLDAVRKDMTIASVITDLKGGGDKAKVTWLAACGLEFPDVPGKLIELTPGTDNVGLKLAFVTSDAEFEAAKDPNMDVKVVGQPDAAKLEKDNPVRFTGTLVAYDPDPAFMLHFDKAKVNEEDIPKEKDKGTTKKKRPATTTKKPSGR
jgi:tetratricopeptide (TPR) repeat protein